MYHCIRETKLTVLIHILWDQERSRIMGLVMGAIATGVLIGYPMGGILFDFVGESCPFIVIVVATSITLGNLIFQ